MSGETRIEWTDSVWNPCSGCSPVSAGCDRCYARRMAKRLAGRCGYPADEPFRVTLHPDRLELPLRWRKPRRVFVDSMSDLFHPEVPEEFIDGVFAVMAVTPQHTYQVLTKRPARMREYVTASRNRVELAAAEWWGQQNCRRWPVGVPRCLPRPWPLSNVWLGVSVEDQQRADERIPLLLQTPAAVRFVSLEPLLGPVDLSRVDGSDVLSPARDSFWDGLEWLRPAHLDWLIVGAETGPGARPCDPAWVQSIIDQVRAAGVPVFLKDNLKWAERIQEYPQGEVSL